MKVFKMDDYDWVAANSEEEAKKFYMDETGVTEDELDIKECNIKKDGMFTEIELNDAKVLLSKIASYELVNGRREVRFSFGDCGLVIWKTFKEVLEEEKYTTPHIIASTEW